MRRPGEERMPREDDGLYLPEIKRHSLEKLRRHNYYAAIFSKAMSRKWPQRAYIGLYSGAGLARLAESGEIVVTSALAVCTQEVPFTRYIFVDEDERCIEALDARIEALDRDLDVVLIQGDVNDVVGDVIDAVPSYGPGQGLLSLCFIDPFNADFRFSVIRALARYKIDFLILLPFGFDVRRNLRRYLSNEDDERIAELVDDPDWRDAWRQAGLPDRKFVRFLLERFDRSMQSLGFRHREWKDTYDVHVTGKSVFLYSLALYSRHERGQEFWRTTLESTDPQYGLGI